MGKLRAHDSKDVADLAKEIVKKWKNDVDKAKAKTSVNGKPPGASPLASCPLSDGRLVRKQSTPLTPVATPTPNGKAEVRNSKSDGVKITVTGDNTRDRCAELIYDGLACDSGARESLFPRRRPSDSGPASDLITDRAIAVEKAVFAHFGGTTPEYRGKIRSLFVNLKDKANPSLRESIVSGELSPEKFSKMTSEVPSHPVSCFARSSGLGNDDRGSARCRPKN